MRYTYRFLRKLINTKPFQCQTKLVLYLPLNIISICPIPYQAFVTNRIIAADSNLYIKPVTVCMEQKTCFDNYRKVCSICELCALCWLFLLWQLLIQREFNTRYGAWFNVFFLFPNIIPLQPMHLRVLLFIAMSYLRKACMFLHNACGQTEFQDHP